MSAKRLSRREFLRLSLAAAGSAVLAACGVRLPFEEQEDKRPNFLVILTDDQRYDSLQYMPRTQARIFDRGVSFKRCYSTSPLCDPSRNSLLTGMYAQTHGIHDNNNGVAAEKTFIEHLHETGYYTGMVGKYLNAWSGEPRPEFDYWVAFPQGESRYNNPRFNDNGEWVNYRGRYSTDVLGAYAEEFTNIVAWRREPFCLFFAPNAPHMPATPAEEDKQAEISLPELPPSFNEIDVDDKPAWVAANPALNEAGIQELLNFRRDQARSLLAVDRTIDRLLVEMENDGLLNNTAIIFTSDNGKLWGEHRLDSKNCTYEEASRVPLALFYPPLVSAPYTEERVVANIDIAPTLYRLADIPIPNRVEGLPLTNLLDGDGGWRDGIIIEGWPGRGIYTAFHTGRYI